MDGESIAYAPWEVLHDVLVQVEYTDPQMRVLLPWVSAKDYTSMVNTCGLVAGIIAKKVLKDAQVVNKSQTIDQMRSLIYEPPLVRFKCEVCEESWDAWVDDDGNLEDKWSVVCTNPDCLARGEPATLLHEEL